MYNVKKLNEQLSLDSSGQEEENSINLNINSEKRLPKYATFGEKDVKNSGYSVKIARDFEDMAKVIAIRASACFTDPEHLYAKHFDGNDFSATHLIGYIGDEPVAAIRIRYFAAFGRIERLTVRPTHRKSRIAFKMVQAAFDFCRDKGYRRLSGVAREEMVPFWSLFGGEVSRSRDPIYIYGLPHFEMHIEFPEVATAITQETDTMVLLRPEGRWHEAGHHETINVTQAVNVAAPPPMVRSTRRPADVAGRLAARADRGTDTSKQGAEGVAPAGLPPTGLASPGLRSGALGHSPAAGPASA